MKALQKTLVSAAVLASVLFGVTSAGAGAWGDEFEPNSNRELAMQIFEGQPQLHRINPDGDEDWIMFVPRQSGRFVLQLTNVTTDLKGELWVQVGRNDEERVEKFKIDRHRDSEIHLDVTPSIGYFKVKLEADDNDDTGSYRLDVTQVSVSGERHFNVRRPDVFESDNRREFAIGIRDDSAQLHTIYPRDDEDWLLFAPPRPGQYLLKISGVTTDLKGEVWMRRDDEKERRIGKFEVSRSGRAVPLTADHRMRYFKIRLEADDSDETGDYTVEVVRRPVLIAGPTVIRQTVVRSTLCPPPIYRRPRTTIYKRPHLHRPSSYRHRSDRGRAVVSRFGGSLRIDTGKVKVSVGVGRSGGLSSHVRTSPSRHRPSARTLRSPNTDTRTRSSRSSSRSTSVPPRTSRSVGSSPRLRTSSSPRRSTARTFTRPSTDLRTRSSRSSSRTTSRTTSVTPRTSRSVGSSPRLSTSWSPRRSTAGTFTRPSTDLRTRSSRSSSRSSSRTTSVTPRVGRSVGPSPRLTTSPSPRRSTARTVTRPSTDVRSRHTRSLTRRSIATPPFRGRSRRR